MTDLANFSPCKRPGTAPLLGTHVHLLPTDWDAHGAGLSRVLIGPSNDDLWTYMPLGPFGDADAFAHVMRYVAEQKNWVTLTALSPGGHALGCVSYMRQRPEYGSVEIGCVLFSKGLQRTTAATEILYLMASHVFDDLGYRRFEWKCDSLNMASRRAALRFGFAYEGLFRNDMIVKGRNRDTAWFAMTSEDWPAVKAEYERWLAPDNFDSQGRQITPLQMGQTQEAG